MNQIFTDFYCGFDLLIATITICCFSFPRDSQGIINISLFKYKCFESKSRWIRFNHFVLVELEENLFTIRIMSFNEKRINYWLLIILIFNIQIVISNKLNNSHHHSIIHHIISCNLTSALRIKTTRKLLK